jgi:hypothetical protein
MSESTPAADTTSLTVIGPTADPAYTSALIDLSINNS